MFKKACLIIRVLVRGFYGGEATPAVCERKT